MREAYNNVRFYLTGMKGHSVRTRIEAIDEAIEERNEQFCKLKEKILVLEKEIERVLYEMKLLAEEGVWLTDNEPDVEVF